MTDIIPGQAILTLGSAVAILFVFKLLRLPALLAYLFLGTMIGPMGLEWVSSSETVEIFAESGLIMLLFIIGLEMSLSRFWSMRHTLLTVGLGQLFVTVALFALLAVAVGVSVTTALIVGFTLAISSTALVSKQLVDQREVQSRHGRTAMGVLLFQDLAIVPVLIILSLSGTTSSLAGLSTGLALLTQGALLCVAFLLVFRYGFKKVLYHLAATRSPELFCLTVLLITLSAAWFTQYAGFTPALGAFIAGLLIGDTPYRHQAQSELRPFYHVLIGLFFLSIGMLLDVPLMMSMWPYIVLLAISIIIFKSIIVAMLCRYFAISWLNAWRTGLLVAQGSEFGFVLLSVALNQQLLEPVVSQFLLQGILLSMVISPFIIRHNKAIAKYFLNRFGLDSGQRESSQRPSGTHESGGHIVVCGYGAIGQTVSEFLNQEAFAYKVIDSDPDIDFSASKRMIYGDATCHSVLMAAGLDKARMLVVTFSDIQTTLAVLELAKRINPDLTVLVRSVDDSHRHQIREAGAIEAIPASLETGLMIGAHVLLLLDIAPGEVMRRTRGIRTRRYQLLRDVFRRPAPDLPGQASASPPVPYLMSVTIQQGDHAVGHSLNELGLDTIGVIVTAIHHASAEHHDHASDAVLHSGDRLELFGIPQGLSQARNILVNG